jgi:hypothetical protein
MMYYNLKKQQYGAFDSSIDKGGFGSIQGYNFFATGDDSKSSVRSELSNFSDYTSDRRVSRRKSSAAQKRMG